MTRYLLTRLILAFLFAKCVFCDSPPPPDQNSKVEECVRKWIKANKEITSRFSRENMTTICQRRQRWAEKVEQARKGNGSARAEDVLTPDQLGYWRRYEPQPASTAEINNDDAAPPPQTTSDSPIIAKALRKEYRVLTDQERASYHAAVKQLKTILVDGLSRYDIFVRVHSSVSAPGAHFGHSFLPWHREFLTRYELALREVDPNVALPYWDSTLDQPLRNPVHTIMWTEDFAGTADGKVVSGPFANWALENNTWLERHVSEGEPRRLFYQEADVQYALSRTLFRQFSWCVDETFEGEHGGVHVAVGGQMSDLQLSPSDPIFYMHHCFVDYMWEQFRQTRQTASQREQEYPSVVCEEDDIFYRANATMRPFDGLKNIDGLSNRYTRDLYSYQQRPVCNSNLTACTPASPYLFCNKRSNKCVAKVRPGGNCSGFSGQDVCYKSTCTNGRCVA